MYFWLVTRTLRHYCTYALYGLLSDDAVAAGAGSAVASVH